MGSYSIKSWYNSGCAVLWCNEITSGILNSRCKMTPTHHAIRSHRYGMHAFTQPVSGPKGASYINTMKHLQLCSSHVVRHISLVYEREVTLWNTSRRVYLTLYNYSNTLILGVSQWYKVITTGVFISCCKMTPKHYATRYHWCWMFSFAKILSEQRRGNLP